METARPGKCIEVAEAQFSEILDDQGKFKPVCEWPPHWQRMVTSYKVKPVSQRSQDGKDKSWDLVGYEYEFRFERGGTVWKLIGEHVGVRAFPNRALDVNLNVSVEGLNALLTAGRERVLRTSQEVEAKLIEG